MTRQEHSYHIQRARGSAPLMILLALVALPGGCGAEAETDDRCSLGDSPAGCTEVLLACATATGRTPYEICGVACDRKDGRRYRCEVAADGTPGDGLYLVPELPATDPGAMLVGEVALACSACKAWPEATACSPD